MPSTFGGLNVATRALASQQVAINTTSHNIANANTPGFSRQDAILETSAPYTVPAFNRSPTAGQLGTGVEVTAIRRLRDTFIDGQIRVQTAKLGEQQVMHNVLEQIEVVFNEPADSGLNTMMSRFFNAWQSVANRPDDRAIRAALVEEGSNLAAAIRHNSTQLTQIRDEINQQLQLKTGEINSFAQRIAALNAQISQVDGTGQQPNDLRDQRDLLVDQLSKMAQVSFAENPNGSLSLFIGSRALVLGNDSQPLTTGRDAAGNIAVLWEGDGSAVNLGSGDLQGLVTVRDTVLRAQHDALDLLANGIITHVNALHTTGYGLTDAAPSARAFFTGADASSIRINAALIDDPGLVAAADSPDEPGNNAVALAIARLRDDLTMDSTTATFHKYYQSTTATLGTASRQAASNVANQRSLIELLDTRKQAVAGVNLDEEVTNLIKYQHAYQAAARVVTSLDEMLDVIINRMGRVGL